MAWFFWKKGYNEGRFLVCNCVRMSTQTLKVMVKKDGEGFLAEVVGKSHLYAFAYTEKDAIDELKGVIDMMVDHYSQELVMQKKLQKDLLDKKFDHAL